jgi:exopolysaccharide biosynthesis predicted pyruvyltransferase EpsI
MTSLALASKDAALFAQQAEAVDACLDKYIPAGRPVALLQFPYDFNVGNHMMWIAAVDYLKRRSARIAYAAHGYNFDLDAMKRALNNGGGGDGVIVFLGGVTVSRLWPRHAEVKRMVAASCPSNRLVSLPSTMLFVDDEDRREAATIFGDHRNVVLMARDPVSAASAREVFPDNIEIVATHDSTVRLPVQPRLNKPVHDIIWLARDDKEGADTKAPDDVNVFDWPQHDSEGMRVLFPSRVFSRVRKSAPMLDSIANAQITDCYERFARWVLASGNRRLDTGKVLVTDRMHPHIHAALRSQPVVLLPDRFGKNRAVYESTSHAYSSVHWADTTQEALERARALARNPSGDA